MKITVMKPVELDIAAIRIKVPVRYGTDDIRNDFPLRRGDVWEATVDLDTWRIRGWPEGREENLYMKVCDEGTYTLLDRDGKVLAKRENYVPHSLVPGNYGDYVDLQIDGTGKITNAEEDTYPDDEVIEEFFESDD